MNKFVILSLAIFGMVFFANIEDAKAQQFVSKTGAWNVYTYKESGGKVCYMTANPSKKTGNYSRRGDPYMIVSFRGGTPEVSYDSGFPYRNNSEVDLVIDGKKRYKFFTSSETPQMAWAKNAGVDSTIITAMKKGGKITAKGTSRKGTYAQDTFSLKGFTASYNKMIASCKK